jgi:D-alanine-D-alanine ligase
MKERVVLLHDVAALGGRPDESDTLVEAHAIATAVQGLGYETAIVPVGLDLAALERTLAELAPRIVFNLVESLEGRGELVHVVPALLEALRLPVTGCSAAALGLTSDKPLAKRQLERAGLPTPATFGPEHAGEGTWIVKSVSEHASLGLDDSSVVRGAAVAATIAARQAELGGEWFAERFVPGRELNVALLAAERGPRVLPVAEIRFRDFPAAKPAIVGYAAKWHTESFEYRNTERSFAVERELAARAAELALDCWRLFALAGYARVDLRVDAAGAPWVLEVNANPCLSPDAGFAAALAEAGLEFGAVIAWLLEDALRRAPRGGP